MGLSSKVEFQKSRHVDPAAKHRDGGLAVPGSKDELVSSPSQWDSDDLWGTGAEKAFGLEGLGSRELRVLTRKELH